MKRIVFILGLMVLSFDSFAQGDSTSVVSFQPHKVVCARICEDLSLSEGQEVKLAKVLKMREEKIDKIENKFASKNKPKKRIAGLNKVNKTGIEKCTKFFTAEQMDTYLSLRHQLKEDRKACYKEGKAPKLDSQFDF